MIKGTSGVDTETGEKLNVDAKVNGIVSWLETQNIDPAVNVKFGGASEEQEGSASFLGGALIGALFLMFIILLAQFNSIYNSVLVLLAVVLSTTGVLIGMLVMDQTFSIIMTGTGIVALAGIVVNNNIVLIDTYNNLKKLGQSPLEAALRTGAQRLRPVILTSVTTALGLMPMVIGVNLNFFTRDIVYGAPSTQWWTELSSAIAGGLVVATVLTLIVTPALLMFGERNRRVGMIDGVPAK